LERESKDTTCKPIPEYVSERDEAAPGHSVMISDGLSAAHFGGEVISVES